MQLTSLDAKMENPHAGSQNNREDSLYGLEPNSERSVTKLNPECALSVSFKHLQTRQNCIKDPNPLRIPSHVVSLDGKYLRRCLELIRISASKSASSKISVNFSSGVTGILAGYSNPAEIKGEETFDTAQFVFECPLVDKIESLVMVPATQTIVTGSKSTVNLLKSPLYRQFGTPDGNVNFRRTVSEDDKAVTCYSFMNSPGQLGSRSSQKLIKEEPSPENRKFGPESLYKRLASVSSSNSTCSDQSSAASASVYQGTLQCTWRDRSPRFVFSVDGQKETYVANLSKVDSSEDKSLNYVYLLHSTKDTRKAHENYGAESHLVGKMKVSTSFTLCPNNSRIMETVFVFYGKNENHVGRVQTPSHSLRKIKDLSKKVVDVFKTSNSSKQRTLSKFSGSGAIQEYCVWDPHQDTNSNCDDLGEVDLLDKHLPPNFELAAIVVKDHLPDSRRREVGGWGMKFLKNAEIKQTNGFMEESVTSECCARNTNGCSTSMDIIVPAGLHGGPKTRNGGPSSLIERWKSGGCCECGGWDMGCPLTVLNALPSKKASLHKADVEGGCKAFDFTVKASEHSSPSLWMSTVHDGLYFVHFQSAISALQSLSIAVAYIHSRSPSLRPKNVQDMK